VSLSTWNFGLVLPVRARFADLFTQTLSSYELFWLCFRSFGSMPSLLFRLWTSLSGPFVWSLLFSRFSSLVWYKEACRVKLGKLSGSAGWSPFHMGFRCYVHYAYGVSGSTLSQRRVEIRPGDRNTQLILWLDALGIGSGAVAVGRDYEYRQSP
jgi:hypothetical protein